MIIFFSGQHGLCSSSIFLFAFFIEDLYRLLMYFPFPVNLGSIDVRTLRSLDAVLVDADGPLNVVT
jgi:hypothetical protein